MHLGWLKCENLTASLLKEFPKRTHECRKHSLATVLLQLGITMLLNFLIILPGRIPFVSLKIFPTEMKGWW